jgi:hypothetical protein
MLTSTVSAATPPHALASPAAVRRGFWQDLPKRWHVMLRAIVALCCLFAVWTEPLHGQSVRLTPETLAGVWRGQEATPLGNMAVEVIFFPDARYSRAHTAGSLMTRDIGSYTIVENWIHFRLHDYWPKRYKGRPLTRPMSDTWVVSRFDGKLLQATVGGSSQVAVQRVQ